MDLIKKIAEEGYIDEDSTAVRRDILSLITLLMDDGFSDELNAYLSEYLTDRKWPDEIDPDKRLSCEGRFMAWCCLVLDGADPSQLSYALVRIAYRLAQEA